MKCHVNGWKCAKEINSERLLERYLDCLRSVWLTRPDILFSLAIAIGSCVVKQVITAQPFQAFALSVTFVGKLGCRADSGRSAD